MYLASECTIRDDYDNGKAGLIFDITTERKYFDLEPDLIDGVCGVSFKGQIHFFGGFSHPEWDENLNYENQHFGFDQNGNFVKYKDLDVDFHLPACINFNIVTPNARAGFKPGFKNRMHQMHRNS